MPCQSPFVSAIHCFRSERTFYHRKNFLERGFDTQKKNHNCGAKSQYIIYVQNIFRKVEKTIIITPLDTFVYVLIVLKSLINNPQPKESPYYRENK